MCHRLWHYQLFDLDHSAGPGVCRKFKARSHSPLAIFCKQRGTFAILSSPQVKLFLLPIVSVSNFNWTQVADTHQSARHLWCKTASVVHSDHSIAKGSFDFDRHVNTEFIFTIIELTRFNFTQEWEYSRPYFWNGQDNSETPAGNAESARLL